MGVDSGESLVHDGELCLHVTLDMRAFLFAPSLQEANELMENHELDNCSDVLTCEQHGQLSLAEENAARLEDLAASDAAWEAERIAYEADIRQLQSKLKDNEERELTSWASVDLDAILDGDLSTPQPRILRRKDGKPMLYAGRTHSFIGPSESGKTLGAYLACAQELNDGHGVVYVDFEGEASDFVRWMLALGVSQDVIRKRARYISPDDPIDSAGKLAVRRACIAVEPTLVVFDGVTEAMMLHGLNDNAAIDTAKFMNMLPRQFERAGVAVLLIDHAPHDGKRATGSQHKRSAVTGASYLFIRRGVLRPGHHGKVDVEILKDRPGSVRRVSNGGKAVGVMHVSDTPERPGRTDLYIEPVGVIQTKPKGDMERVSRFVEENADASRKDIERGVEGDRARVGEALDILVEEGGITVREQPHGSQTRRFYTSVTPYRG